MNKKVAEGEEGWYNVLDWRSWKLPRVARSTLSAESQGASEAADALLFASTFWNLIWSPWLVLDDVNTAKLLNAPRLVVDAKALYDLLIKEEVQAGTGADKRTTIEVLVTQDKLKCCGALTSWVSSELQYADGLTKESAAQLLADRLRSHQTRLKSDLTFQAAKRKTANERKKGAEMYAIKKPGRAMHAMFAGLLNVVNALDYDNKTNNTETEMPNVKTQNLAEHYFLDTFKVLFMIFTTIMMLLFGWVMLHRRHRHQGDQAEPEEAPSTVTRTVMTPEDEATFRAMYEEVMTLREYRKSLEAELMKKQQLTIDARDEARLWKAKYEHLRPDFVRMLEDTEVYILPHSNIWHADLNCVFGRTDGQQTIYGCQACRLCTKHIGKADYDFKGDARASAPPGAWRIGDLADASVRGSFT